MSIFEYTERYRDILVPDRVIIRAYFLGKVSDKAIMVITDKGQFIEMEISIAERSEPSRVSEIQAHKLNVFGMRYSGWRKTWAKNLEKMDKIAHDWDKVMQKDEFVDDATATQIIDSKIGNMHGYKALICESSGKGICTVSLESRIGMSQDLYVHVAKCSMVGMKRGKITETELFKKISKKILKKHGVLWGSRRDLFDSSVTFDLSSKSVVHVVYSHKEVHKTRKSIEEFADKLKEELVWKGVKTGEF